MTNEQKAMCAAWVASHAWQLEKRERYAYSFREQTLVRYYEEANLDTALLEPLIEYLNSSDGAATVRIMHKDVGGTWKPYRAWYVTGDGDRKASNELKRTRIYQALVKEAASNADGPYVIENGCVYKITHKFVWRASSVEDVGESESGVEKRITSMRRDEETGLWDYVVEVRTRVQVDVSEYVTSLTSFEERREEKHLGVKKDDVSGTGEVATSGGGMIVTRKISKNDDCTSDVTNETIVEQTVAGARETKEVTVHGTRETTVNRNMTAKASADGLKAGERVENELTDGGLWNQTIVKWTKAAVSWVRKACRKTAAEHEDVMVDEVEEDPGFSCVEEAGGGVIHEKQVERTDEGNYRVTDRTRTAKELSVEASWSGPISSTTRTSFKNAQSVPSASAGVNEEVSASANVNEFGLIDGATEKTTFAGKTWTAKCGGAAYEETIVEAINATAAPSGTTAKGSVSSVSMSANGHGSLTTKTVTRTAKALSVAASWSGPVSSTTRTGFKNYATMPDAGSAGDNEDVTANASVNEFGLLDGTIERTSYKQKQWTAKGGSGLYDEEIEEKINTTTAPSVSGGNGVIRTVSMSANGHGSLTTRKVTRTAKARVNTVTWTEEQDSVTYTNTLTIGRNASALPNVPSGYSVSVSISINEYGLYDYIVHAKSRKKDSSGNGTGGSTYTASLTVHETYFKKDGKRYTRPWTGSATIKRLDSGSTDSGFLASAHNYPNLGLTSYDGGKSGICYGVFTPGTEQELS